MEASFTSPRGAQAPSLQDLPQMTERMLRYAADMSSLWFDAMNMMVSNLGAQAGAPAANGGAPAAGAPGAAPAPARPPAATPGAAAQPARIVLDVRSPEHAAEVIVALDEPAPDAVVEELRNVSGHDQGGIGGVKLATAPDGATRVRVRVPKGLAPGRYSGAVLAAATRRPIGRVTVVLDASDDG
jgi:hypothetical protein